MAEKRRTNQRLLDLTVSNPTEVLHDYPHADIARAYGAIPDFRYQPEPLGAGQARRAIASWYERQGIAVDFDRIALTASSSEAYGVLFKLLCDPGDEILIPCPSYPLFEYLARAEAIKTQSYHLNYDGAWFVDWQSLRSVISPRTKAVVVVNPNNPTGSYLKENEARQMAAFALDHDLAIVSDEVFMTYGAKNDAAQSRVRSLIGSDDVLSFSLNGLSKAAGMPQMKLGWIVVNGPREEVAATLPKLELLLDNYLSVGTPVQMALGELLKIGENIHGRIEERVRQNREALNIFQNTAVEPLASEGGWTAILRIPNVATEEEWITRLLAYDRVIVQPGFFYDMPKEAFLVVSLIADAGDFQEGMSKIKDVVRNA